MDSAFATEINPLAVLKTPREPKIYSLEAYLRREENAVERHEYFNGIIKKVPMARGTHNIIAGNTITALNNALEKFDDRYIVMTSNQKVFLPNLNVALYPDALVVCEKPLYWDKNEVLLINPLIVVEVLSKSTQNYDRREKFAEYKSLPSFMEYVLIEQKSIGIETRFREAPDLWRETIVTDPNGKILLKSIGVELELSRIYRKVVFG